MRAVPYLFTALAILLIAPTALAASFEQLSLSMQDRNAILAAAICIGFVAMVLLLPDFDGRTDEDWDGQGRDDLWKS